MSSSSKLLKLRVVLGTPKFATGIRSEGNLVGTVSLVLYLGYTLCNIDSPLINLFTSIKNDLEKKPSILEVSLNCH